MIKKTLSFLFLFLSVLVHASEKGKLNITPQDKLPLDKALNYVVSLHNLDGSFTFKEVRNYTDELGIKHVSYQQYYNGVAVENGMVMFHAKKGNVYYINGTLMTQEETPNVSINSTRSVDAEPTVLLKHSNEYVECYKRNDFKNHKVVFISKESGDTIKTLSTEYNVMGKGLTMYSGMQDMEVSLLSNNDYSLLDAKRKILTTNAGDVNDFVDVDDYCQKSNPYTSPTSVFNGMLAEISITDVYGDWYYSILDTKPDLYIKIYDGNDNLVYKSDVKDDQMTATWDLRSKGIYFDENYYIEIYDEDIDSDDYGCRINLTETNPGKYNWKTSNISGTLILEASPAIDVHWGMQKVYDFYLEKLNRKSFDNKGATIYQFIDPYALSDSGDGPTHNYNNASANTFPDGLSCIIFGLGDGKFSSPYVGLDVMAHEFTHLVTRYSVIKDGSVINDGLDYENESGALNESFADIMGTTIEFYVKGDQANWLIGEDFMIRHYMMRSLSEPKAGYAPNKDALAQLIGYNTFADVPKDTIEKYKKEFSPLEQQPDTYKGEFWIPSTEEPSKDNDNGGVHTNSGVQNYWFYLLSEGGSGVNDNGDAYEVTGIGIESAYKIAYRNLTTYLLSNATFNDAMEGSLKATIDLFGKDTKEYEAVQKAWYAVGVADKDNGIKQASADELKFNAYSENGQLIVKAPEGSIINVYNMAGQVICSQLSDEDVTYIDPRGASIVVVKIDNQSQKVIIK